METDDVFTFLRSLDNGAVADGTADTATHAEPDLFAGSEPIAAPVATPADPSVVETAEIAAAPVVVNDGAGIVGVSPVATTKDVLPAILAAVTDLHERLTRVEAYLRQNGVL